MVHLWTDNYLTRMGDGISKSRIPQLIIIMGSMECLCAIITLAHAQGVK